MQNTGIQVGLSDRAFAGCNNESAPRKASLSRANVRKPTKVTLFQDISGWLDI